MAQTIFALKGKLGSTEYYVVTMKIGEAITQIRIPKEVEGWDDLKIEEQYQREINNIRVKSQIAPYIASDKDRFFGSLVVAMKDCDAQFEALSDVTQKLPLAYKNTAKSAGFLTINGGTMFPIDGQHRLQAMKFAVDGKDTNGNSILEIQSNNNLSTEDITVILFPFDTEKSRKIFSKVNRYAKATSKAQNLITDDDDYKAVITREIANNTIDARMVNFKNNTLTPKSIEFTTLATLYETISEIIKFTHDSLYKKSGQVRELTKPEQRLLSDECERIWNSLIKGIEHFEEALRDTSESGDSHRKELREEILLLKPIVQLCIVSAFVRVIEGEEYFNKDGSRPKEQETFDKINKIDWSLNNEQWQQILMNGSKVMAGKATINFATDCIIYMLGYMSEVEEAKLLERYKRLFLDAEKDNKTLPDKVTV